MHSTRSGSGTRRRGAPFGPRREARGPPRRLCAPRPALEPAGPRAGGGRADDPARDAGAGRRSSGLSRHAATTGGGDSGVSSRSPEACCGGPARATAEMARTGHTATCGCQVGAAWPAGVLGQGVTAAGWRSSRSTRPGRTGAGECADRVSTVVRAFPQIPLDPRQPPETRPRRPCSLRACGPRAVSASAPGHGPVRRCTSERDTPRTCSVVCAAASLLLPC